MTEDSIVQFRNLIMIWHRDIDRGLPWKTTKDPYKIWLSEIILQQTRVAQGLKYYRRFISTFPTIQDLAAASEDEIMSLWKGLGYYSRARNLRKAAQQVIEEFGGVFPSEYTDILSLKGIGPYTAAAISSFAFDLPYAVVDGNVYRVLSRYFGVETPVDSTQGKKEFQVLADLCLDREHPGAFNQAIMDFGALHCKPISPGCHCCPLQEHCVARQTNRSGFYPVKSKKIVIRHRYFHFILCVKDSKVLMEKRTRNDVWKGLYQLPLIETSGPTPPRELSVLLSSQYTFLSNETVADLKLIKQKNQRLTHQLIHGFFYVLDSEFDLPRGQWVSDMELDNLGMPKIIDEFFNHFSIEQLSMQNDCT